MQKGEAFKNLKVMMEQSILCISATSVQRIFPCYCSSGPRVCVLLKASKGLLQAFVDTNSKLPGAFVCFTHNSHFLFFYAFFIVFPEAMSWLPSGAPHLGSGSLQIAGLRVLIEHSAGWSWLIRD